MRGSLLLSLSALLAYAREDGVRSEANQAQSNDLPGGIYAPDPRRRAELARTFPNPWLTTQENSRVRFFDDLIKDKVVVINFMFTTGESLCPRATANLAKVQENLGSRVGRDIRLLSLSVDPEHDTVAVLREYASRYGARPGWYFLTGKKSDIDSIRKYLGAYDQGTDNSQHSGLVICGNEATGKWMAKYSLAQPATLANFVVGLLSSSRT